MLYVLRLTVTSLLAFLRSLPSVAAHVLDIFCVDALDAAAEASVPAFLYYASSSTYAAMFLRIPQYLATTEREFKDMGKDELIRFPGGPPVPASDMARSVLVHGTWAFALRTGHHARSPEAKGLLINTYEWLEARAVGALRDGACVHGRPTPPVYCIGPLTLEGEAKGEWHACLSWLDAQPDRSVVFLCFGSLGAVSAAQLKEITHGLENSDLDALLPEGFLERTRKRGLVLKMWAPQWNSVLEAASTATPMLCWPLAGEQRLNKLFVVSEMKAGFVMEGYNNELVKAGEVEKKVRLVMEESGEVGKLRDRVVLAKEKAVEAQAGNGS
ncbi:hypothetical protein BRADI_2g19308v3 [Brachypodium distachyon]|uniref:UDP-glycosyltransferases domain-containing protein n=1 Tax=Brachypodium distachyon TaxID=15368 RepID=A0A0Q3IHD9_BRADI|nr:hypothetical protein BRADI_2g19308v3 [Brachypodium distachyon]